MNDNILPSKRDNLFKKSEAKWQLRKFVFICCIIGIFTIGIPSTIKEFPEVFKYNKVPKENSYKHARNE